MTNPRTKGRGKNALWLKAHVAHDGDECLIWPFCRKQDGRGQIGYEGRLYGAHELMCIFVNGPKPTPKHETAHSCGNGHNGCVHPRHVSWKTPTENHQDTIRHGHARKYEKKLTDEQAAEIRSLKGIETQAALAVRFAVSNTTIAEI